MKYLLFFLLALYSPVLLAQDPIDMGKGSRLRAENKMAAAIAEYRRVYAYDSTYSINIYALALAFAQTRQADSCFHYLYKACRLKPQEDALTDPDLYPVRNDPRWPAFENRLVQALEHQHGSPYKEPEYARKLWRIGCADQAYYTDIKIAGDIMGRDATVIASLWDLKSRINRENLQELEGLIVQKGWPKISEVGPQAATAAFLVIQHSDLPLQQKYLPLIRQLCEVKEADWQSYALMYDRIQTSEGKPQRYGSQVRMNEQTKAYELFPLEDESKVDQWRAEAGLGPLAAYVAQWKITFPAKKK